MNSVVKPLCFPSVASLLEILVSLYLANPFFVLFSHPSYPESHPNAFLVDQMHDICSSKATCSCKHRLAWSVLIQVHIIGSQHLSIHQLMDHIVLSDSDTCHLNHLHWMLSILVRMGLLVTQFISIYKI